MSLGLMHAISGRFGAEFRVSSSRTGVGLTPAARIEVELTRSSFEEFFGRVAALASDDVPIARAVVNTVPRSSLEVHMSARLRTSFRKTLFGAPYVMAGAGFIRSNSSTQQVKITGNYRFSAPAADSLKQNRRSFGGREDSRTGVSGPAEIRPAPFPLLSFR